jgi:hypothetical protein
MPVPGKPEEEFLRDDLYDALRWLFEGAIAWEAARRQPQCAWRHQAALGMYTSLVQARALYEFYYKTGWGDDSRAKDFGSHWKPPKSPLYKQYMDRLKPAQKRVFHLVLSRGRHAGGTGPTELKNQVVGFAKDLRRLTEDFSKNADPVFQGEIQSALRRALQQAHLAAAHYGIPNPL